MAHSRYDETMTELEYKRISSREVLEHIEEEGIEEVEIESGSGSLSSMDRIKIARDALRSGGYKVLSEGIEPDPREKRSDKRKDPKYNIENLEVDDSWYTEVDYRFTTPEVGLDDGTLKIRYIDLHEKGGENEYDGVVLSYYNGPGVSDYSIYMAQNA